MAEPDIDDLALWRQMRRGSETAFNRFYERHQARLFRFVFYMTGNQATAEEVTQEVFMLLIRQPDAYDASKGALASYLFGAARNLARRAAHSNQQQIGLEDTDEHDLPLAAGDGVLEKLTSAEALEALRKALVGIPEAYREVVALCDLEEMSYDQAAGALECSTGTIASRLHRAHSMLRARLSRLSTKDCQRQGISHV